MKRNYFGKTLARLLAEGAQTQRNFARKCSVDSATISRLIQGDLRCSRENLRILCRHVSESDKNRYDLLIAHLLDEAEHAELELSNIDIKYTDRNGVVIPHSVSELTQVFEKLFNAARNYPEMKELLKSAVNLVQRIQTDETTTVVLLDQAPEIGSNGNSVSDEEETVGLKS